MLYFTSISHVLPLSDGSIHGLSYHWYEFTTAEEAQESYKALAFDAMVRTHHIAPIMDVQIPEHGLWLCKFGDPEGAQYWVDMWTKEEEA